jgi:hypothetical protein
MSNRAAGTAASRLAASMSLIAAATCWVTAVAYSSFLFAGLAGSRLPVARSYVSELEAAGQPHRGLFRLSEVLSGLGLIVLAALAARLLPRTRTCVAGCGLLAAAGVGSLFDAANSMTCAPSIDVVCRDRQDTAAGLVHQVTQAHTASSLVGFLATAVAVLLLGAAVSAADTVFARVSIGCAILTGLTGLSDLALILAHSAVGISERARISVFSLWLLTLGVRLLRPPALGLTHKRSGSGVTRRAEVPEVRLKPATAVRGAPRVISDRSSCERG